MTKQVWYSAALTKWSVVSRILKPLTSVLTELWKCPMSDHWKSDIIQNRVQMGILPNLWLNICLAHGRRSKNRVKNKEHSYRYNESPKRKRSWRTIYCNTSYYRAQLPPPAIKGPATKWKESRKSHHIALGFSWAERREYLDYGITILCIVSNTDGKISERGTWI